MVTQKQTFKLAIKAALCALLFVINAADAQTPFYQGKTLTIIHGRSAGGAGDLRARAAEDPSPLMPEANEKAIRELPRDRETIELYKKFAGAGPLPPR
jgi:hypothetical protein